MASEQNVQGSCDHNYNYFALFDWDPSNETPFFLFPRSKDVYHEIPEKWWTMSMGEKGRQQRRKLKCLDEMVVSVFGKLEKGLFTLLIYAV